MTGIGLDIGGTKVAAGIVDEDGRILATARAPMVKDSHAHMVESICAAVDDVLAQASERPRAIGIAVPGTVDRDQGIAVSAVNIAWQRLPLVALLRERYGLPGVIANDANAGAWGEYAFGMGKGSQNLVFITVGTGIGGGIIESGRVVRGYGSAGEIGHILLSPGGPLCPCGVRGCLESLAAGPGIARRGRAAAAVDPSDVVLQLTGGDANALTSENVRDAAAAGDPAMQAVRDDTARWLAMGCQICQQMLAPECIVFAGGVMQDGGGLISAVRGWYQRLSGSEHPDVESFIRLARESEHAGILGAAALVLQPEDPLHTGT